MRNLGIISIVWFSKVVLQVSTQWRSILLVGALYKIFMKAVAIWLQKLLSFIVHSMKYGFLVGRNILHNILNVKIVVDYARHRFLECPIVKALWAAIFRLLVLLNGSVLSHFWCVFRGLGLYSHHHIVLFFNYCRYWGMH